jgi:uncharacterized protein YkwD
LVLSLVLQLLTLSCAALTTPIPFGRPALVPTLPDPETKDSAVAELINEKRVEYGLSTLTLTPTLTLTALRHSEDMASHDFFDHASSDGTGPGERVRAAGYDWVDLGEIIACGYMGDPHWVVDGWMESPEHRQDILNPEYEEYGVGYVFAAGTTCEHFWTVDFGKPAAP